jgi:hypothetical protein
MPLQVPALPIKLPNTPRSHKGRFRDRDLVRFAEPLPQWPNFEYLNALAAKSKVHVNFFSKMQRWPPTSKEGAYNFFNFLFFKVIKHRKILRHRCLKRRSRPLIPVCTFLFYRDRPRCLHANLIFSCDISFC